MFRNQWKNLALSSMAAMTIGATASSLPARAEATVQSTGVPVTCTTLNCKSLAVFGAISDSKGNANAWEGQFKIDTGSCARFDVVGATSDLEMTVIQPDGAFFRNDDKNGSLDRKPRVIIANPIDGVYTVIVYKFDGGVISETFSMKVKQYTPASNPNCTPATVGAAAAHGAKSASSNAGSKGATGR